MKFEFNSKQVFTGLALGLLVATGTYNAIVINSESIISSSDTRFAKRLDEVYNTVSSYREVAASVQWQKVSTAQAAVARAETIQRPSSQSDSSPVSDSSAPQAAVREDLNLSLTAVINPKKWQQGLTNTQFSGSLSTNGGVIESMNVSLPNGEGLSISFSEMTGNVFEYDFEGELYSGMMYQEGAHSYAVSLTNGPLEGTRMTFTGEPSADEQLQLEESQRAIADADQAGHGMNTPEPVQAVVEQAPDLQQSEQFQSPPGETMEQNMYAQEQTQTDQQLQEQAFNFEQNQAAM